jgi:hypothetical protein
MLTLPSLRKDHIEWECNNGGQPWTPDANQVAGPGNLPSGFCTAGFASLNIAFIASLLADLVFQLYMAFMNWRFCVRLETAYTPLTTSATYSNGMLLIWFFNLAKIT